MKERLKFFYVMVILSVILVALPQASALEDSYCVTSEVTDISPTSIEIGEEFTVGVHIENCGSVLPEEIYFELITPPTDISIKEPLILQISKMYYGNSERFITYHMKVSEDANPGRYLVKTRLSYGKGGFLTIKNGEISLEVIGKRAELNIASFKTTPVLPIEGGVVELNLRVENSGEGSAKSVEVYINHSFKGVKQAFIGTLEPDEDGPAVFTFIAEEPGRFEFPAIIKYSDDFGKKEISTILSIEVLEKESKLKVILISLIPIAIIVWLFLHFVKMKKAKDRVIHQLLRGNKRER